MAIATTRVTGPFAMGSRFAVITKCQLDSSYPAGGWPLPATALGFAGSHIGDPEFAVEMDSANGWGAVYNYATQKLLLFTSTGTTSVEVTAGTNCSAAAPRAVATARYL